MNEGLHLFLQLVLRNTNAHRHMDLFTGYWDKNFFLEFCPDSFRCNSAIRACCHGQDNGEFLAAITIRGIRQA